MTLSLLLSILLMQGVAPSKGGVVMGTLRDPYGQPAARVRVGVMALPEAGRGGGRGAGTLVSQVATDNEGRFQLDEVPPGRYYILAGKVSTPTFYPGVLTVGTAKTVEVRASATVRDIDFAADVSSGDFVVPPPVPLVITGRIVLKNTPNGPRPAVITLRGSQATPSPSTLVPQALQPLVQVTPSAHAVSQTIAVAPDGSFSATFPPGDLGTFNVSVSEGYSIVSVAAGGRNVLNQLIGARARLDLVVTVDVGDLRPHYRVIATIRDDSTDRLLAGEQVELVPSSGDAQRLTVNAQGVVTFPTLLPGTYVLRLASADFEVPEKRIVITDSSVQVELRARKK